jgi:signal transduction histidine kinase
MHLSPSTTIMASRCIRSLVALAGVHVGNPSQVLAQGQVPHEMHSSAWYLAAILGLALVVVVVVHLVRVRQIARVMSADFDQRLSERIRAARELHDTLLQTVHGSKLVVDRALRDTTDRDRLVQALEQLSVWLGQAAAEGPAALQSLGTSTTESDDLAAALRRAIDECRIDSSAEISFSVQGRAREFDPAVRDEVYRIGYEAIRNACVHSGGSLIDVTLEYGLDLTLRIGDNGVGIRAAWHARTCQAHWRDVRVGERSREGDGDHPDRSAADRVLVRVRGLVTQRWS